MANRQYGVRVAGLNAGVVENSSPEVFFITDPINTTESTDPKDPMNSTVLMENTVTITCNGELDI